MSGRVEFMSTKYATPRERVKVKLNRIRGRINRLEASGFADYSQAYRNLKQYNNARFNTRGMTKQQLLDTEKVIDQFLSLETSTISGVKHNVENMANVLGVNMSSIKPGDARKVMDTFLLLKEESLKIMQYCNMIDSDMYQNYREPLQDLLTKLPTVKEEGTLMVEDLESAIRDIAEMIDNELIERGGEGYYVDGVYQEWFPNK